MWNLVCRPLSYHPVLRHLCNTRFTGLTCYEKKSPPCENFGLLRHAAACCGMLQNPHVQIQKKGAAACCGMLRHVAAALACSRLQLAAPIGRSPFAALPLDPWTTGIGAHRPLTLLCPSSSGLSYLFLSTSLSFPLVGRTNAAPGLSCFTALCRSTQRRVTSFAVGQVRPSGHPSTPPQQRLLGPGMSTYGVYSLGAYTRGGLNMVRLQCPHYALASPAPRLSLPSVHLAISWRVR